MTTSVRKRANDDEIIQLNNIGMSLMGIADRIGVHHTTVAYRLKNLGIQPADTRRAFMEDIYRTLTPHQQEWLVEQLNPGYSIKDFVRSLIVKEYVSRTPRLLAS